MKNQRIRIRDIAEELGLSTATVSNVIHGKTGKISDETVKRVQALLEERQYIPSMAGILLAQNSSSIIGVFINDHEKYEGRTLEDFFISSSLNYLSAEIEKRGLFMMVKRTRQVQDILKFASMWNMDGLVIIGFCYQDYVYLREHMRIPFVIYDGFYEKAERFFNITIDNFDGGFQVGTYFREQGHRKALCISDNDICSDKERYEGFCAGFGDETVDFMLIPMHKEERWCFYQQQMERFRSASKKLILYSFISSIGLSLLIIAANSYYVEIYQVEDSVKLLTRQTLIAYALIAPFKIQNMILGGGILRSGGKTKYVMAIDLIGTWVFGVPLGLLTAFVLRLSIPYVYFFLSLEECIRFSISLVVLRKRKWINSLEA